jgi:hypothetical protein
MLHFPRAAIHLIEQAALRKLRKRLRQKLQMSYIEFSDAKVDKI